MDNFEQEKVCIDEAKKKVDGCLTFMICCAITFALGIWIGIIYERDNISSLVERTTVIDSLIAVNDTIKIKIERLDSIKNAKVIEVSTLDNDSTLKLFKELVSK